MPNKYLVLGAIAAGLGVAFMLKKGAGAALQAVNPMDRDNVINQGATSLYQAVTGSKGTIGGDFYDATHGGVLSNVNLAWMPVLPGAGVINGVMDAYDAGHFSDGTFNPTSTNNAVYGAVSNAGASVTGDKHWTLGGAIYDWTH